MVYVRCIHCAREVRPQQHAIVCDVCGFCQHRTCSIGISLLAYSEAVNNRGEIGFTCRPCRELNQVPVTIGVTDQDTDDPVEPPFLELSKLKWIHMGQVHIPDRVTSFNISDRNNDPVNLIEEESADIRMDGERHFLLATEYQLGLLREAKRWYRDGTFKVLGEPFRPQGQLMSIHVFIGRNGAQKQLPHVFCQ